MINVLHVMWCSDSGGISTVVTNYYSHINRDLIHFDILLTTDEEGKNTRILRNLGCNIYHTTRKCFDKEKYVTDLTNLLKNNHYDAIHVHENETSYFTLRIAKKMGIKCRIAHSHTSSPYSGLYSELKRLSGCVFNYYYGTALLACGTLAGNRVFGKLHMKTKKCLVLPNSIDTDRFRFSAERRNTIRNSLGLSNELVLGYVGRLSEEKNIPFAIKVFIGVKKIVSNAIFLIVGDGDKLEELKTMVNANGLSDSVFFLGKRDDIDYLYSAMDVLLLPSIHEGFPLVLVESACSGLPAMISNRITDEFHSIDSVHYLSIDDSSPWIEQITKMYRNASISFQRESQVLSQFDINNTVKVLENIYLQR